jgi:hypothetical protein
MVTHIDGVEHVFVSPIGVGSGGGGAPQGSSQLLPRYLLGGGTAVASVN